MNNTCAYVKRHNFTSAFLKAPCQANQGAEKNSAGLSLYILRHMFLKFSNTLAENNVSPWTYKSLYFQNLFHKFSNTLRACNLHQCYVPYLSDYKSPLLQVMMFNWIFPNHRYIYKDNHLSEKLIIVEIKKFKKKSFIIYWKIVPLGFYQTFFNNFCYNVKICILLNHL